MASRRRRPFRRIRVAVVIKFSTGLRHAHAPNVSSVAPIQFT